MDHVEKELKSSGYIFVRRLLTSQRANLPYAAIPIPRKIDRSSDGKRRDTPIATSHGRRMAEAAGDIPVIVMGLGQRVRYQTIYQTLGVAGHKNFRSGGDLMKEAASRPTRNMVYDDE